MNKKEKIIFTVRLAFSILLSTVNAALGMTSAGAHTHTVTAAGSISTVGSSGTGMNMPPYLVVYMYKRTA